MNENTNAALRTVVDALTATTDMELVWPKGLLNPGGPHRRLAGTYSPISIGEDECLLFGKLIAAFRPENCFIVGNAFGMSSAYIAAVMREHGGTSVIALDSRTEGEGQRCGDIADRLKERLGLDLLQNKVGFSPEDTPAAAEGQTFDLVFIDGLHAHPQVTRDFDGLLPFASERTIFVWHDSWMPGIPECVAHAHTKGFHCLWIPTSCEMVIGTRDSEVWQSLKDLFPGGEENRKPRSKMQFYWIAIKSLMGLPFGLRMRTIFDIVRGRGPTSVPRK